MKKVLAVAISVLLVFCFAACGNNGGDEPDMDNGEPAVTEDSGEAAADEGLSEALSWWEGQWYGYWVAEKAGGDYAEWDGGRWDCYAVIDVDADGSATMYIWDDEIDMATAEIKIDPEGGVTPMGSANSTGGEAFAEPLGYADWTIMPTYDGYEDYYGNAKYDDYMEFEGLVDTDDVYLRYTIALRPWGILWDDVPAGDRPPFYEEWYVAKELYNEPNMLDVLVDARFGDEAAHIHSALAGGATGGQTGGDAVVEEPTGGDDGDSAPSGGVTGSDAIIDLTNDELKEKWNNFQNSFSQWSDITYDMVVSLFNSPGVINRESDTAVDYRWYASDDGSLTVQFKKPSMEFARSSMNQHGRPD